MIGLAAIFNINLVQAVLWIKNAKMVTKVMVKIIKLSCGYFKDTFPDIVIGVCSFLLTRQVYMVPISISISTDFLRIFQHFNWSNTCKTNDITVEGKMQKLFKRLTIVVGVAQRPGLVRVKVCVSSDASAGEVGVGQETPLSVEGRAVTMETRGEEDHDVSFLTLVLDL